jgi:hypothetical protein
MNDSDELLKLSSPDVSSADTDYDSGGKQPFSRDSRTFTDPYFSIFVFPEDTDMESEFGNGDVGSKTSILPPEENEVEQGGSFPRTFLVIRLAPNIQPAAVTWFVKKITGKKQDGGAELLVRCEPFGGRQREVSLYLWKCRCRRLGQNSVVTPNIALLYY